MDTKAFEQTHYRIEKESIDLRKACEETCQAIDRKRDEPMAKVVRKPDISAAMAERIRLWQAYIDSKQKVSAQAAAGQQAVFQQLQDNINQTESRLEDCFSKWAQAMDTEGK